MGSGILGWLSRRLDGLFIKWDDQISNSDTRKYPNFGAWVGPNNTVLAHLSPKATSSTHSSEDGQTSEDDQMSETSTIVYDHEPFSTFQSRVQALVLDRFSNGLTEADQIAVERMEGGAFNRVISFAFRGGQGDAETEFILRVPRFGTAHVDDDVAILLFLSRYNPDIPAPVALAFDESDANVLEEPYSIQNRISGCSLYPAYPQLCHSDKLRVARDLGLFYAQAMKVQSSAAGRLVFPENQKALDAPIHLAPFGNDGRTQPFDDQPPQSQESISQWLDSVFDGETYQEDYIIQGMAGDLRQMANELREDGYLGAGASGNDRHYVLAHLDLAPRNILMNPGGADADRPIISAILDWDSAVFVPRFMACAPPMWIWAWGDDDEGEDERMADEYPGTDEERELKRAFEEHAGPSYMEFAYGAGHRLARSLVRLAIGTFGDGEDWKEADKILEEWAEIREAKKETKPATLST